MQYTRSQWESALSDLKDAAHVAGVTTGQTDRWTVRHDIVGPEIGAVLGRYADGAFRVTAVVGSPTSIRALASLYPDATDRPASPASWPL